MRVCVCVCVCVRVRVCMPTRTCMHMHMYACVCTCLGIVPNRASSFASDAAAVWRIEVSRSRKHSWDPYQNPYQQGEGMEATGDGYMRVSSFLVVAWRLEGEHAVF